jgi:hypothetical protein
LALHARREHVEQLVGHHELLAHVLRVHERCFPADRDHLFERAHLQVGVHRGGEPACEADPVAPQGVEPRQRKRYGIGTGPQIHDVEAALAVRRGHPNLFDESGTRGFDGDARQHPARGVPHHARNAACLLSKPRVRERQHQDNANGDHACSDHFSLQ